MVAGWGMENKTSILAEKEQHNSKLVSRCASLAILALVLSSCSQFIQLPDDQLPIQDITISKVEVYKSDTNSYIQVRPLDSSFYSDFACTKYFMPIVLMSIPGHTVTPAADGRDNYATITPKLDPTQDSIAHFDTSIIFYHKNVHIGAGPQLITKYHIATASINITYND